MAARQYPTSTGSEQARCVRMLGDFDPNARDGVEISVESVDDVIAAEVVDDVVDDAVVDAVDNTVELLMTTAVCCLHITTSNVDAATSSMIAKLPHNTTPNCTLLVAISHSVCVYLIKKKNRLTRRLQLGSNKRSTGKSDVRWIVIYTVVQSLLSVLIFIGLACCWCCVSWRRGLLHVIASFSASPA